MCEIIDFTAALQNKKNAIGNILEVIISHENGETTLYLDAHDMPSELKESIINYDDATVSHIESYFDDYFIDAEIEDISLTRGNARDNSDKWKEIFNQGSLKEKLIAKIRGKAYRFLSTLLGA